MFVCFSSYILVAILMMTGEWQLACPSTSLLGLFFAFPILTVDSTVNSKGQSRASLYFDARLGVIDN